MPPESAAIMRSTVGSNLGEAHSSCARTSPNSKQAFLGGPTTDARRANSGANDDGATEKTYDRATTRNERRYVNVPTRIQA